MGWLIIKYLITAAIIVGVSEVAKRNEKLGALLVTLPELSGKPRRSGRGWIARMDSSDG
jgi:hypothetical protein